MEIVFYLVILVQSFILSAVLTALAIRIAPKLGFLDHPNTRKVHVNPKPLLGGAAIYITFVATILLNIAMVAAMKSYGDPDGGFLQKLIAEASRHLPGIVRRSGELTGLIVGASIVFLVGLYDDRFTVKPLLKLGGQIIAALVFAAFYYHSGQRYFFFVYNPVIITALMTFWIVGVTNSLNLMDNMDGLCAGVSIIALFFLSMLTYQLEQQTFMILTMLALMGALLGFLYHNFNPARIFMGDAGSMFVGFTISCLVIFSTFYTSRSETILALAMPPVILAVPMFDTATVIAIRIKRGLPIYQADKNHFSHRLVSIGMSHKSAVLLIYLISICTGIGALLLTQVNLYGGIVILSQVVIILAIILLLERAGRYKERNSPDS